MCIYFNYVQVQYTNKTYIMKHIYQIEIFTGFEKHMNIMGVLGFPLSIPVTVWCIFPSSPIAYNFSLVVLPVIPCICSPKLLCLYIYYDSFCLEQSFVHLTIIPLSSSFPFFLPLPLHPTLPGYLICIR